MTVGVIACLTLVFVFAQVANAAVLDAGEGKPFKTPSAAIAKAKDGTVRVAAGVYKDCATIKQNNFTLEGWVARSRCGARPATKRRSL